MHERKPPKQNNKIRGHHVIPRTRGGNDSSGNIIPPDVLDPSVHRHWHKLFANDMPEEVVAKLLLAWDVTNPFMKYPGSVEVKEDRISGRKRAWKKVFGDEDQEGCIKIVIAKFSKGREEVVRDLVRNFNGLNIKSKNGK